MKLTGALILNNFENSIQKKDIKNLSQFKKETSTSEISNVPSSNISKFESIGIANQEKSKYFQTQISLLQKGENTLDEINQRIYDIEDTQKSNLSEMEKNIKIQEIIKGIESLTKGEEFQKNEILSKINVFGLGLDGYISSTEKEKVLNEARLQTRLQANELGVLKKVNENELTKVRLANENLKAAKSINIESDNLRDSLDSIKQEIENKPVELNNNLSQARVMNILNS